MPKAGGSSHEKWFIASTTPVCCGTRSRPYTRRGAKIRTGVPITTRPTAQTASTRLALPCPHHLAHGRMSRHDGHHPVDARLPDGRRDVDAGDPDAALAVERDGLGARELGEGGGIAEVHALPHREPRERAVHRARVE